jgi:hypothetical protein
MSIRANSLSLINGESLTIASMFSANSVYVRNSSLLASSLEKSSLKEIPFWTSASLIFPTTSNALESGNGSFGKNFSRSVRIVLKVPTKVAPLF